MIFKNKSSCDYKIGARNERQSVSIVSLFGAAVKFFGLGQKVFFLGWLKVVFLIQF